jgi:orotidine-5'-phosphate decarboxylase
MSERARVFCALDRPDPAGAVALARRLAGHVDGLKVGLELVTASGPEGVRQVVGVGLPVFLDVKFHDIPNTVAGAVRAAAGLGVAILNVHCQGGATMLRAAKAAASEAGSPPAVIGVTVLTSLDDHDLDAIGMAYGTEDATLRLGALALEAGLDGLVCSPQELTALRERFGREPLLVVPGIRPGGGDRGDQKRTMAPAEAQRRGADILVIGRPITAATDPVAVARAIRAELEAA